MPDSFAEARQRAEKLVLKGQGIEASDIIACCNAADAAYRLTQLWDPKSAQATWENAKVEARATPFATVVASLSEARYCRISWLRPNLLGFKLFRDTVGLQATGVGFDFQVLDDVAFGHSACIGPVAAQGCAGLCVLCFGQ